MYLNRSERTRQAVLFGFRKTLSIKFGAQTILQGLEPAKMDRMLLVCIRFDRDLFCKQRKQA